MSDDKRVVRIRPGARKHNRQAVMLYQLVFSDQLLLHLVL